MVQVKCTAINNRGEEIISMSYNLDDLDDADMVNLAAGYAFNTFIDDVLVPGSYTDETVRIVVDVALPPDWYRISKLRDIAH